MFKKKEIFNVHFDESVKTFGARDGIISIIYYFYNMIMLYLFGLLMFDTNIYRSLDSYFNIHNIQLYKFIFYIPIAFLQLVPIFILIRLRKQDIKSIGLKIDKTIKSIFLGIIFSFPFIIPSIIDGINKGNKIINFSNFIWLFFYFLIEIAFVEEVSFRGFIQTRIQGLIKKKWLSIIVVGIMFSLMHIPFQIIRANVPLNEFVINDSVHLLFTCVIHIYLVYVYTRDNNIISTSVTHALIDFVPSIFIQ